MNKLITLAFVLLIQLSNAQTPAYWVRLKDKNENTFSLKQPEAFLSPKALERRQRQHIEIVQNDLPVSASYIQQIRMTGVQLIHWSKWFNTVSITTNDPAKIEAIRALPFVQSVELLNQPVAASRISKFEGEQFFPARISKEQQNAKSTSYNYGPSYKQADQIGIVCMHANGYNGDGVTIQEEMNWAVGAEFADSVGADIISTSLGYSTFDDTLTNHTYKDMDGNTTIISKAADLAASKGIFVTVSAGNEGSSSWFRISAPADADSVLTVGAIDSLGNLAYFSSRGPSYDGRVKPNTVARGYKAYLANPGGTLGYANGTSFSCPITAGAVACLWQAEKNKTNMDLLKAIQESASQYSTPDSLKGYGIPDFCKAKDILTGIANHSALESSLTVYPNPFQSSFTIFYTSPKQDLITLELRDITGRILKTQTLKVSAGQETKLNFTADKELAAWYVFNQCWQC